MAIVRPSTMLLAIVIDSPAVYHAAVTQDLSAASALYRFLIAIPVAAVMLHVLRLLTANYGHKEKTIRARSERLDADGAAVRQPPDTTPDR